MKRSLLLLYLFILGAQAVQSQDLRIQYDRLTGITKYEMLNADGTPSPRPVKKPYAKRNKNISVKVTNLNPFAFQVTHQVSQTGVQTQFDSTRQLIPYFDENVKQFENFLKSNTTVSPTRGPGGVDAVKAAMEKARDSLLAIDDELAGYMECYQFVKSVMVSGDLTKEQIVAKLDSAIRAKFSIDESASVNTSAAIRAVGQRFRKFYQQVKQGAVSVKSYTDNPEDPALANAILVAVAQADTLQKFYSDGSFMAKLAGMGQLLQTVKNARFVYEFEEIASMDIADITLTITNKQARIDADTVRDIQNSTVTVKKYRVIIKGENVVRVSVGLAFPTLLGSAKRFGVQDLKVSELDDDNVVPNLTTFVNFYPFKGIMSNFGGVLGFGYPLSSAEKDLNILGGLSYTTGDKNAVVFSGGLVVGQTNKLQPGWRVGDEVPDATTAIPTDKTWKVGLFLGISISFSNR